MIYAGIGARATPPHVLDRMQQWGAYFARYGFTLRSGRARGADSAFELGHNSALTGRLAPKYIYRPEAVDHHPNGRDWLEHASRFHPAWDKCGDFVKKLHARNSPIILGERLDIPVDFVMCWTADGKASGGTGQALRIAKAHCIPIFNMQRTDCEERLLEWLR